MYGWFCLLYTLHNASLLKSKPETSPFQNKNLTIGQAKTVVILQGGYKSINALP
jgi:hypothetical protein